jgi:methionyl-tRNA synthetase
MPEHPGKFYVTTPIYYVNARPHIGHAYTTIVADVLARRHRLLGDDTFFLTGTDEHGQKIERSASAAGIAPQQFADQVSAEFAKLWQRMGITNDQYIRTTDAAHKRGVQKLFSTLYERGQIYLSSYTGQYSVGEEMFVEGPPGTIGPDGKPTETVTEENFFFRLSDYQLQLLDLIESDTLRITPEARKNEVLSFVRGNVSALLTSDTTENAPGILPTLEQAIASGRLRLSATSNPYIPGALKDLSISRSSFKWGIPVPEPAASLTKDPHIIYVWLDALANYMTAVGYGDNTPEGKAKFERYWPADLHLVGKEIIRFHCVYWPAFLLAAGLPLPSAIAAHGWLLFDDSKMSKSKGNIVRTETILDAFGTLCPAPLLSAHSAGEESASTQSEPSGTTPTESASPAAHDRDLFAADVLRYFLLREIPFGQDGSFTFDALITRYNADLANGYGNLVSRTLSMIHKYFAGIIPNANKASDFVSPQLSQFQHEAIPAVAINHQLRFFEACESNSFSAALEIGSSLTGSIDGFITSSAPWKLAADDLQRKRLEEVLYTAAESIRILTALLFPFLPYATANVWRQLGLGDIEQASKNGDLKALTWGGLKPGTRLGPLSPIFPRADKGLAQIMTDMEAQKTQQAAQTQAAQTKLNPPMGTSNAADTDAQAGDNSTHPGAPPRTGTLCEPNPGAQVGASTATNPERAPTPTHSEAPASGIFAGSSTQTGPADASLQITIDDFAKVELRVAKVLVCERIPKADKLLRLEVDLGYERRQILSGIAEWYTPEDLIGRRIVVITNLAPRTMRGLESHGMLLAASAPTVEGEKPGKPALATFLDSDDLPLGSRLK